MKELSDFFNDGFGWACRHCFRSDLPASNDGASRWMTEGEAEAKVPDMANKALAKWADPAKRTLICPRCGVTERAERS